MQAYCMHKCIPEQPLMYCTTHLITTHYCGLGSLSDPLLHRHSTTTKCVAEVHLNMHRMPRDMIISLGQARKHQNFIIMSETCLFVSAVLTDKHVTSLLCQQHDSVTIWSAAWQFKTIGHKIIEGSPGILGLLQAVVRGCWLWWSSRYKQCRVWHSGLDPKDNK